MRVFLSSTYSDLREYRRTVSEALTRLGLSLSRMEDYGARPDDATCACLDEIEQSVTGSLFDPPSAAGVDGTGDVEH